MRAVLHEEDRERLAIKLKEIGVRVAYERFEFDGKWYLTFQTNNATLYYFCKSLMTEEERTFFYD